jgi:PAS domain S-box-containing protein
MKKRLVSLGADVGEFSWIIGKGKEGALPGDFGWFENQLRGQSAEDQARFLGAIAMESDYPASPEAGDRSGVISFTIPTGSLVWDQGGRKTMLLWARVNFASSRKALTADLICFSVGIIMLVLVSSNIFHDYTVLRREMSNVLKKMSQVMYEASTPFAWINEKNEFIKVNESFLEVLGYANEEDLKSHSPTFRGLITAETQPKYDEVLSRSAAGGETGKYEVDIRTREGDELHVVIHGERIPYPTFWRRGLPHRFGVFLEWSKKVEAKQPETRAISSDTSFAVTKHARAQQRTERIKAPKSLNQNGL